MVLVIGDCHIKPMLNFFIFSLSYEEAYKFLKKINLISLNHVVMYHD